MFVGGVLCEYPATVRTATGIDVLIVRPALSPRYVLDAPNSIPSKAPVTTALIVNWSNDVPAV